MSEIWTMGELLVEVMRPRAGMSLGEPGEFLGPFPSGAPGIFIDAVGRLGRSAAIVGGVGEDAFGRCIIDRLRKDGVSTDLIEEFPDRATGVAFVTYFLDGSRDFIYHFDGTPAVMAKAPDPSRVIDPRFFHVMGCSLMANDGFRDRIIEAVELFASKGAKITFDPNIRRELLRGRPVEDIAGAVLRRCSILLPGEDELRLLAGREELGACVSELFDHYPLEIIVLKRGSRGCTVFTPGNRVDVPAYRVEQVDPTGAGDCFDAGFLCGMLEENDAEQSARIAAAAGALSAAAFGPMEGKISPRSVADLMEHGRAPVDQSPP
jgi:tagatose kinase